jgi:uncharacterized protein (TIGR01244 family)
MAFMIRRPFSFPTVLFVVCLLGALAAAGSAQQAAPQAPTQAPSAVQAPAAASQAPQQSELPEVRNFTRVDATIACAGQPSPNAMASIKEAGFKSIVNLRAASEDGANVEAETKAAEAAGIKYFWLPFVTASPDASKVDEFLKVVAETANQPILIHCASGGRVSMFWAIKRVMLDGWPVDKAMNELPDLSKNVSAPLKAFALEYLKQHGK